MGLPGERREARREDAGAAAGDRARAGAPGAGAAGRARAGPAGGGGERRVPGLGTIRSSQLTSLRRDEERSFRSSPFGRPYYLCAALTDRLSPARGYLTVSTWPVERRVVGPLSPRVDFLTCAIRIAEHTAGRRSPDGDRLLSRMARNIPGAGDEVPPDPARVAEAARRELAVHAGRDAGDRAELAGRADTQLDDVARLFGATTLTTVPRSVMAMGGGR
ncbi:hypothetical protein ACFSTC_30245 [Nonomuraea ferruginea]